MSVKYPSNYKISLTIGDYENMQLYIKSINIMHSLQQIYPIFTLELKMFDIIYYDLMKSKNKKDVKLKFISLGSNDELLDVIEYKLIITHENVIFNIHLNEENSKNDLMKIKQILYEFVAIPKEPYLIAYSNVNKVLYDTTIINAIKKFLPDNYNLELLSEPDNDIIYDQLFFPPGTFHENLTLLLKRNPLFKGVTTIFYNSNTLYLGDINKMNLENLNVFYFNGYGKLKSDKWFIDKFKEEKSFVVNNCNTISKQDQNLKVLYSGFKYRFVEKPNDTLFNIKEFDLDDIAESKCVNMGIDNDPNLDLYDYIKDRKTNLNEYYYPYSNENFYKSLISKDLLEHKLSIKIKNFIFFQEWLYPGRMIKYFSEHPDFMVFNGKYNVLYVNILYKKISSNNFVGQIDLDLGRGKYAIVTKE